MKSLSVVHYVKLISSIWLQMSLRLVIQAPGSSDKCLNLEFSNFFLRESKEGTDQGAYFSNQAHPSQMTISFGLFFGLTVLDQLELKFSALLLWSIERIESLNATSLRWQSSLTFLVLAKELKKFHHTQLWQGPCQHLIFDPYQSKNQDNPYIFFRPRTSQTIILVLFFARKLDDANAIIVGNQPHKHILFSLRKKETDTVISCIFKYFFAMKILNLTFTNVLKFGSRTRGNSQKYYIKKGTKWKLVSWMHDANDKPIGRSNQNPFLDIHPYEVEFTGGEITELTANIIAELMCAQCDDDSNKYMLLESFV